jgi:hypothetical protein
VDALLVFIGTRVFPSTRGYGHFHFSDYATLTTVGVLIACAAWPIVTRISSAPRWLFVRLAILVTFALWLPDIWLLVILHQPERAVAVLMTMHFAIALVTYNLLVRVAPVRMRSEPDAAPQAGSSAETVHPDRQQPARASRSVTERSLHRLATTLSVLVGVEFLLGMAALFSVPFGRPSGWLPTKAAPLYLAHAIVGAPLAVGAVMVLVLVRGSTRTLLLAGWSGFGGVAIAGLGGVLAVSHPLRLLGMALMFVGPMIAFFAYLLPVLVRMPTRVPPNN